MSTELRALRDPRIFEYADYLCYDAGYGALTAILEHVRTGEEDLHKTIVRRGDRLVAHGFDRADLERFRSEPSYEVKDPARLAELRVDRRLRRSGRSSPTTAAWTSPGTCGSSKARTRCTRSGRTRSG